MCLNACYSTWLFYHVKLSTLLHFAFIYICAILYYNTFICAVYFTTMYILKFILVVRRLFPRHVRNDFNKDVYIHIHISGQKWFHVIHLNGRVSRHVMRGCNVIGILLINSYILLHACGLVWFPWPNHRNFSLSLMTISQCRTDGKSALVQVRQTIIWKNDIRLYS